MSTDISSKILANFNSMLNGSAGNDSWRQLAAQAGSALSRAEETAMLVFSFNDKTSQSELTTAAKALGLTGEAASKATASGLQLVAQSVVDKLRRVYEAITNFFKTKDRTEELVVSNLK